MTTHANAPSGIEQAKAYLASRQPSKALELLDRTSWPDLAWSEYWMVRSQAFLQLEDYRQATKAVKMGLEENANHAELWILYVEVLLARGDLEQARAVLEEANAYLPSSLELQDYALSLEDRLALLELSPKTEAIEVEEDEIHLVPDEELPHWLKF